MKPFPHLAALRRIVGGVMPSLTEYVTRVGKPPKCITSSLAAYIAFYHTAKEKGENCLVGIRGDGRTLNFFLEHKDLRREGMRAARGRV